MMRQLFKFLHVFYLIALLISESIWVGLITKDSWTRRKRRVLLLQRYSSKALKALNIDVYDLGERHTAQPSALYVGNHLSYVDILVIASRLPTCFVTSVEVRQMPGIGWLTELGGCIYVERRSRAYLGAEIYELSEALIKGLNVTIFPEATSTDGTEVLRFRRPLYQAAINSLSPVKSFCLNYLSLSGEKVEQNNRNKICWYGKMPFLPHLWSLAGEENVRVRVHWLATLFPYQNDELTTTAHLAESTYKLVQQTFIPLGPINVIEKETGQDILSWPVHEGGLMT